jgi:hypothetical protein
VNRSNQGNKAAFFIMCNDIKFARVNDDGVMGLTSCPHDCTLFTSRTTAELKCQELKANLPMFRWVVRATRTHRPNEYVG